MLSRTISDLLQQTRSGRVSRRAFMQASGLGAATAALSLSGVIRPAAAQTLEGKVTLATWPNYHNQENFEAFQAQFGPVVDVAVFGSNEEVMAKMQAGDAGYDVIVPSNYAIEPYVRLGFIEQLDVSKLPNYDAAAIDPRFAGPATVDGKLYAVPKNWGTTGFVVNREFVKEPMSTVKDFFEAVQGPYSGYGVMLDHQISTVGLALVSLGYSLNSLDSNELQQAEDLLIATKPHLFAITSDFQPIIRSQDAYIALSWNFDARQLRRDIPTIDYIIGQDGGEIWCDYYVVASQAPNKEAAYALVNYLIEPDVNLREFEAHGGPIADERVKGKMSAELLADPIMYPAQELLAGLEFATAEVLTNEHRNEVMARFKAA